MVAPQPQTSSDTSQRPSNATRRSTSCIANLSSEPSKPSKASHYTTSSLLLLALAT